MQIFQNSIGLQLANNQGGYDSMNITNRAHNKRYSYPIAHTKKPVVICTNITSGDVDRDGWATSGTYSVTDTGFTYISAQNLTEGFQWLSIGK